MATGVPVVDGVRDDVCVTDGDGVCDSVSVAVRVRDVVPSGVCVADGVSDGDCVLDCVCVCVCDEVSEGDPVPELDGVRVSAAVLVRVVVSLLEAVGDGDPDPVADPDGEDDDELDAVCEHELVCVVCADLEGVAE